MQDPQISESAPEENASNWIDGRFDPEAAAARREQHRQAAAQQPWLQTDYRTIAQQHRPQHERNR